MLLAFGIVAALFERERSNLGQVVDAAIVDGVSSMMSFFDVLQDAGRISFDRRENWLAGGAPFYRTYPVLDGSEVTIGPPKKQFYLDLLEIAGARVSLLQR